MVAAEHHSGEVLQTPNHHTLLMYVQSVSVDYVAAMRKAAKLLCPGALGHSLGLSWAFYSAATTRRIPPAQLCNHDQPH